MVEPIHPALSDLYSTRGPGRPPVEEQRSKHYIHLPTAQLDRIYFQIRRRPLSPFMETAAELLLRCLEANCVGEVESLLSAHEARRAAGR